MHRCILSLYKLLWMQSKEFLQPRERKSVGRLPLFCFDIFENGFVRKAAETFILIYVLNGEKNEIS